MFGATTVTATAATVPDTGMPYTYGGDVQLQGNGSEQVNIQVQNHSFKAHFLVACKSDGTQPAAFSTRMKVNGRDFSNVAIHSANMWGTAANPFPLLTPITFPKGTYLEFTFTDLSGDANNFSFGLQGVELND